jgi:hypothetical protein
MGEVRSRVLAASVELIVSFVQAYRGFVKCKATDFSPRIVPHDDFVSRYRTTNFEHEKIIGHNLHSSPADTPARNKTVYDRITAGP